MKKYKINILQIIIVGLIAFCSAKSEACSLALHDWQLKFFVKIPINAPLIPLSEMSAIQEHFKKPATDKILWAVKPGPLTPYLNTLLSLYDCWVAWAQWQVVPDNKSVLKIAKQYRSEDINPIVISSDRNYLKIAVFLDANSHNNCCQIVIAQDSRIRCVFQDSIKPWAQEVNGQSWYSFIFYRYPIPGYILSFSSYPVNGQRVSIYEDHPLVEELLMKKYLSRRPDLVIDPYSFDFPDLPE